MDDPTSAFLARMSEAVRGTFWDHLGARLEAYAPGSTVVTLDIQPHHLNMIGILHGGVYAALIDSAMGLAAMATKPDDKVVTTNMSINYLAPIEHGIVKVTAEIVHSSRKMITTQGRAFNENGGLCAFGTGTFRIINRAV